MKNKTKVCSVCGVAYRNGRFHEGRKRRRIAVVKGKPQRDKKTGDYIYEEISNCDKILEKRGLR